MSTGVALIVVDVQNDFLPPSGSLAVPSGREVIPVINQLLQNKYGWDRVVASQDYHPPDHISFVRSHPPAKPFDDMQLTDARGRNYTQKLWPAHCVQGTAGVEVAAELVQRLDAWGDKYIVVRKGWHAGIESYSAFEGYTTSGAHPAPPPLDAHADVKGTPAPTELADALRAAGVGRVVVTGVATDYCVGATARSALEAGFDTVVLGAACRAIDGTAGENAYKGLEESGGHVIRGEGDAWEGELSKWLVRG